MPKCKVCKEPTKFRACSMKCAIELVKLDKEKKLAKQERLQRKADREQRIAIKPRSYWMAKAQQAFNAFIRERDKDLPCICCGRFDNGQKYGGNWDAGHFLGVGAYPELRFEESNCHRQLKTCNAGSGKYSHKDKTVSQEYRERLIVKIGIERVEWLEGPHEPKKYTIDDLKAIIAEYRQKLKSLPG